MASSSLSHMFLSITELPTIFNDLTPIPQNEVDGAAARIDYSDDFVSAYDYQRAVWNANEKNTERALQLTAVCLRLNPANYTVWHFRRLCLEEIYDINDDFSFIKDEMALAALLGGENPKNYQIWYHRRSLLERLAEAGKDKDDITIQQYYQDELDYISNVVQEDGKNYHAWSQRQWVVSTISKIDSTIWSKEIKFSDLLIQYDVRNNSAWNQRWFVCHQGNHQTILTPSVAVEEANYALSIGKMDPYNESPWRYLIAILREQIFNLQDADAVTSLLSEYYDKLVEIESSSLLPASDSNTSCSPTLTAAMIDILEFKGHSSSITHAIELADGLANEHDVIRQKYWNLRISKLQKLQA